MFDSTLRKNGQRACISRSAGAARRASRSSASTARAEAVPAGQHQPALRPAEHPRDGAQVLDRLRRRARRRAAADVELGDLGDRRRGAEVVDEARRLVHQRAVGVERVRRELVHDRGVAASRVAAVARRRAGSLRAWRRPASRGCAGRCRGSAYLLAITSPCSVSAQRAVDGARRLREHRLVARPAAAADGAAAAVEQAQPHAVRRGTRRPAALGALYSAQFEAR